MKLKPTAALLATLFSGAACAAPSFVNGLTIPASTGDLFGTSVNDGRLGMFSDLYYDRQANQWWGLSDRGPGGGTLSYETRVQRFTIDVNPVTGAISNFQVAQTIKFRNGGIAYNGLAPTAPGNVLGSAFDPEGIAINPRNGNLLISDEYGPSLYEFDRNGSLVRQYNTPANLVPKSGASPAYNAGPPPGTGTLTAGREGNRGFEGLAISPDGRYAYAMLQNGTVTDGNIVSNALARGMFTRIVKFDTTTGDAVGQFAYRLDGAGPAPAQGRGISAIVALDDHRFMVLERNNRGIGVPNANVASPDKKVYVIDISGATDISGVDLNTTTLPGGAVAVQKVASPLLDLAAASTLAHASLSAMGGRSAEKWEGLTVGPQLQDGSFMLLAGTDNDYSVTQNGSNVQFDVYYNPTTGARVQCDLGATTNCFNILANGNVENTNLGDLPSGYALIPGVLHAYKASAADLGGYTAPVPEPETYAMMLAGLGLLGLAARRRRNKSA
jgi:hypothetical protein